MQKRVVEKPDRETEGVFHLIDLPVLTAAKSNSSKKSILPVELEEASARAWAGDDGASATSPPEHGASPDEEPGNEANQDDTGDIRMLIGQSPRPEERSLNARGC